MKLYSFIFTASVLLAQAPQMVLPDGNGAWLVQVVTRGGILGSGDGDFSASSEGKFVCRREERCPKDFRASDIQMLVETIKAGTLRFGVVSFCNDCITRTITIMRRDSMGVVQTYIASWDETTKGRIPSEVIRIYDAFTAQMK